MPPEFWPSVIRSLLVAVLAIWLSGVLARAVANLRAPKLKLLAVALLAVPFAMPPLVVAYGYLEPFLRMASRPWLEELAYSALLGLRVIPLAVLGRLMLPSMQSAEARYCQRLTETNATVDRWRFQLRHVEPSAVLVGVLVFVWVFHEFELASLWQRPAWTVTMFDSQVQGYALGASWRRSVVPLLFQVGLIAGAIAWVHRCRSSAGLASLPVNRWRGR